MSAAVEKNSPETRRTTGGNFHRVGARRYPHDCFLAKSWTAEVGLPGIMWFVTRLKFDCLNSRSLRRNKAHTLILSKACIESPQVQNDAAERPK